MIETVWHYSREKLDKSSEAAAVRDRHLDYFLRFAEEAAPHLEGPEQRDWLDRCESDLFNFRFAAEWTIKSRKTEAGLRLLTALYRLIEIRGNLAEGRDIGMSLLALPDSDVAPKHKAASRIALGRIAWAADRYSDSRRFYAEAQQIYDAMGDEAGSALADMLTGFLDRGDGNLQEAERRFQRAVDVGRAVGQTYLKAGGLSGLGSTALDRGDLVRARELKEKSLELYERLGDRWVIGLILWGITTVAIAQKDYSRARSALDEWTRITRELGNRWILPYILECEANLALALDQPKQAARLFGATEALHENLGSQLFAAEIVRQETSLATLKERLPDSDFREAWEAGRAASPWDLIDNS